MYKPINPITAMLIRELKEVTILLEEVKRKIATIDLENEIATKEKVEKSTNS